MSSSNPLILPLSNKELFLYLLICSIVYRTLPFDYRHIPEAVASVNDPKRAQVLLFYNSIILTLAFLYWEHRYWHSIGAPIGRKLLNIINSSTVHINVASNSTGHRGSIEPRSFWLRLTKNQVDEENRHKYFTAPVYLMMIVLLWLWILLSHVGMISALYIGAVAHRQPPWVFPRSLCSTAAVMGPTQMKWRPVSCPLSTLPIVTWFSFNLFYIYKHPYNRRHRINELLYLHERGTDKVSGLYFCQRRNWLEEDLEFLLRTGTKIQRLIKDHTALTEVKVRQAGNHVLLKAFALTNVS